jgi:hypothetical protein
MTSGEDVLGHYSVLANGDLQPLLPESSALFRAVVSDDISATALLLQQRTEDVTRAHNVLCWSSVHPGAEAGSSLATAQLSSTSVTPVQVARPVVSVSKRTLLEIAAQRSAATGKMAVLKWLLGTTCRDNLCEASRRAAFPDVFSSNPVLTPMVVVLVC